MSNIEGFQIFQNARAAAAGSNNSSPSEGKLISPTINVEIAVDNEISSSTPSMHIEATQQDAEETRIAERSNSARTSSSEISEAWGLLRQQDADRTEYELHHRVEGGRRNTYSIGRSSKCDITVGDSWVSTNHCLVYCDFTQPKMRVFIEDCSVNGTYINHALTRLRKGERVELRSGDEIFLLNPRKPENVAKTFASFVFINLLERVMAFREISIAPTRMASMLGAAHGRNSAAGQHAPSSQVSERHSQHIEEKYIIGDQIGSGMSGQVYACINKMTSEQFAVKIIDTRKFSLNPGLSVADLREEAVLMQQFDHPNIIRVVDTFQTSSMIYIVMELLRGGDLFDRIIEKERYTEESARLLMVQVLSAVAYLHGKQIIHRDLKPENILLVSTKSDVEVKVTDFGLAKKANREGLKTFCGTPQYFAPEVLQRKNNGSGSAGRYGTAVDMWSLGVILYILLSGTFPFNDDEEILRAQYSLSGIEWTGVSPGAKHLIRSLMTLRADQRFSVHQALKHPWIQGIPYVPTQLSAVPTGSAAIAVPVPSGAAANAGGGKTGAPAAPRATGVRFVDISASGDVVPAAPAPAAAGSKKRQASTAPGSASTAAGTGAAAIAKQASVSKKSNLRRGNSLFAPLELKIKSSQEYTTTAVDTDAMEIVAADVSSVAPLARTLSTAAAPDKASRSTPGKAPIVRASHPFSSATTTPVLTPLTAMRTPGTTPAATNFAPNLASCAQRRTPPDLTIDLSRCSHSSCVQTPTPNKAIIHLTVTSATSCLDSLRVPLFSPAAVLPAASECFVGSTTVAAQVVPPRPAFKRATSFDNSTQYASTAAGLGIAADAVALSGKSTDQLWEELSYRAVAPGRNDSIDPYDDVIEDCTSDEEEDGQGQWGNRESAELDASGTGAGSGGVRVNKRKNKPNKCNVVKAARPAKAYTAKSAVPGGCLKKPAAAQSKTTEGGHTEQGTASVRPPGRQKRSVSFSAELSIVDDALIATAAAAAVAVQITPTAEDTSSNSSDAKKAPLPGREVSAKTFSFDAMEGMGFEKVRIGGDSPDVAPPSSAPSAASKSGPLSVGDGAAVRVVTPKAIDCAGTTAQPASGKASACAEVERADAAAAQTAPFDAPASSASASKAPDGKHKQEPGISTITTAARKTIGIKRTQSSLEQAWKFKQGTVPVPDAALGASAVSTVGGKVVRNENAVNGSSASSGADAEGALLYPAGKKLRVPMKSLTELFRESSTK